MKVIIAAGGTGGHFYPAIALGEAFKSSGNEVIFVGRKGSIEEEKYSEYGFITKTIHASQFDYAPRYLFRFLPNLLRGIFDSFRIVGRENPDAVIGCGGYVSAPIILASLLMGKPYFLYEQNIIPGRANKIFSRFARKVFLGFKDEYNYFGSKGIFTGNPIRAKMIILDRRDALNALGLRDVPTLLVFGGSGGSDKINKVVAAAVQEILQKANLQIIFVTGNRMYDEIRNKINIPQVKVLRYLEDMQLAYSAADFAITRAGAMTLTELAHYKIPSILIPFPFATYDHQKKNAFYLANKGCVEIIDENDFTERLIVDKIVYYFTHNDIINKMKECFKGSIFPENSAELIVSEVMDIVKG
ncbi:MAG: undecaprenyldiphospho-muramoylpentapeptide beta-N-acetylglucosaminyltransferase [Caldisericaceae bacterium]